MLEELMSNLEKQQSDLQQNLKNLPVEIKLEGLVIHGNAAKEIKTLDISNDLFNSNDKEMMEDMLLVGFNRFIEQASKMESETTQNSFNNILPDGFGNLFK